MNWKEDFKNRLSEIFNCSAPTSNEDLEARLNSGQFSLPVPDVLWAYACGHLDLTIAYDDDDSPWENARGNLNHQGSVVPQTALAIPFVLQLAQHSSGTPQLRFMEDALWFSLGEQNVRLPFGCLELEEAPLDAKDPYFRHACYRSLKGEQKKIREIGSSPSTPVQVMATWMLGFLPGDSENERFVRAMWRSDDAEVHRVALLSLAVMGAPLTLEERQELEGNLMSPDERLRLVSALSLAITQLRNEESPDNFVLEEICFADSHYWERVDKLFNSGVWIDSEQVVYMVLEEWEEKEPKRVKSKRKPS